MSDQDQPSNGNLVPAERRDLAPVAPVNPLVSRGLADLAQARLPTMANAPPKHTHFWDSLLARVKQLKMDHLARHGKASSESNAAPRQQPDEDK